VLADPSKRQKFRRHARHLRPLKERESFEEPEPNPELENLDQNLLDLEKYSDEFDRDHDYPLKLTPTTEWPLLLGSLREQD
jgi:hypothetical protein